MIKHQSTEYPAKSSHCAYLLVTALLLGACALGLASCASDQLQGHQPPVTVLKSEPIAPQTVQAVPAPAAQPSHQKPDKPASLSVSHPLSLASSLAALGTPPVSNPLSRINETDWSWLLLLLALLLVLASVRQLSSRRPKRVPAVPLHRKILALARKRPWPIVYFIAPHKEIAVTAFFRGQEHKMHFSRWTTLKKVTAWAVYQCGISDPSAAKAYLTLHDTLAPLSATAHVGHFVPQDKNHLELDIKTSSEGMTRPLGMPN